jgi:hypothetical protein
MSGEWHYIDEISKIIDPKTRSVGNFFKSHAETFFSNKNSLNFCLLEITTILNAAAIGEIFVYSRHDNETAKELVKCYKDIVKKVKAKYGKNIAEYQEWYKKRTYLFIGCNPNSVFHRSVDDEFKWNFDGEKQNEDKERSEYSVLEEVLDENFIIGYLNYYIELLVNDLGLSKYKYYGVIVKPIALKNNAKIIPIGNAYLHFATENSVTIENYVDFINQFNSIYLREKGGRLIKEIEFKLSQENPERPPWEPLFDRNCIEEYTPSLRDNIDILFRTSENFKIAYFQKREQFKLEILDCFVGNGKFSKTEINYGRIKKYALLNDLLSNKKIRALAVSEMPPQIDLVLFYLLYRHLIFISLLAFNLTPADIYQFISAKNFEDPVVEKGTAYTFFKDKFLLWVQKGLVHKPISDSKDRNNIQVQASVYEREFLSEFNLGLKDRLEL